MVRFVTKIYAPHKKQDFEQIMQNYQTNDYKQLENDLPKEFVQTIKYMAQTQNACSTDKVCQLIEVTINQIKNDFKV